MDFSIWYAKNIYNKIVSVYYTFSLYKNRFDWLSSHGDVSMMNEIVLTSTQNLCCAEICKISLKLTFL